MKWPKNKEGYQYKQYKPYKSQVAQSAILSSSDNGDADDDAVYSSKGMSRLESNSITGELGRRKVRGGYRSQHLERFIWKRIQFVKALLTGY